MRKDATNYNRPEIKDMRTYHGGRFQKLTAYNSDRKVNLNPDYTVSEDNTPSTLTIVNAGQRMALMGIELETVANGITCTKTVYANLLNMIFDKAGFDGDFFKVEEDCTVTGECITQTFTKGWLRNNYKSFKAMYEMFSSLSITTNDERCGMHVNLDLANFGNDRETQIENVRKLGYLINKHYNFFKIAFNRLGSTRWCPQMTATKTYWKETNIDYFPTDHSSCCFNMGHIRQNRVEIRLVGGQKNFACFRNTMETVIHIIERIKKLSWDDLDDLTKVFKGCNEKVFDRIETNCRTMGTIDDLTVEKIRASVKPYKGL